VVGCQCFLISSAVVAWACSVNLLVRIKPLAYLLWGQIRTFSTTSIPGRVDIAMVVCTRTPFPPLNLTLCLVKLMFMVMLVHNSSRKLHVDRLLCWPGVVVITFVLAIKSHRRHNTFSLHVVVMNLDHPLYRVFLGSNSLFCFLLTIRISCVRFARGSDAKTVHHIHTYHRPYVRWFQASVFSSNHPHSSQFWTFVCWILSRTWKAIARWVRLKG